MEVIKEFAPKLLTDEEEIKKKIYHIDNNSVEWSFLPYKICFDGKQNNSYITYTYNQIIEAIEEISVIEESCGDMILSEYLILSLISFVVNKKRL